MAPFVRFRRRIVPASIPACASPAPRQPAQRMFNSLLTRVIGSRNDRLLKQLDKIVAKTNALEPQMQALSDADLQAKTGEFKRRHAEGESLDKLLPEAFAVCREASVRVMGMRHYDVQLVGGMVLHMGKIAEMRTGEGKTLVATLPVYLNAISGKGVHVVTVNDYLARRDAAQMGKLYNWLGLSVGVVYPGMPHGDKHEAYAADITYGTNNEFGFDYLRDNMALSKDDRFQRGLNYAIVDEVDSILIDEARTPLIISGPTDESQDLYMKVDAVVPRLSRQEQEDGVGDYWVDEKAKQVHLSEGGMEHVESLLRAGGVLGEEDALYAAHNIHVVHHLNAAMRAHAIYQRDVDYIVRDGEVVIVDEFTGRTLPGRRWSDGLHQAVEAKERVAIQRENQTLASITFQNVFRMYGKLAGMTGTADTEAYEFQSIYGLEVIVIPTHRPMIRKDHPDLVFLNRAGKYRAVAREIKEAHERGQPALVGTTSIEVSELLSDYLNQEGIPHEVLNAKQHEREAIIVAQAGRPKSVTIATNMAGRGTDIVLGGSLEAELAQIEAETGVPVDEATRAARKAEWQQRHDAVKAAGGLHIIGTERHESRRIDNQLRGRSGRQGDPGSSRFYLSLEDNLMRIFASDRVKNFMKALGMQPGEAIEHRMVSNAIEKAQRKVEGRNFDIRKQLLEFDDVANEQRKVIYHMRNSLLAAENIGDTIAEFREEVLNNTISQHIPPQSLPEQWDIAGLEAALYSDFGLKLPVQQWLDDDEKLYEETLREKILAELVAAYNEKEDLAGAEALRTFEKQMLLRVLDDLWKDHLSTMDHLRHGIHLRGYAQKNPKQEYKRESFNLFQELLDSIKRDTIRVLSFVQVRREDPAEEEARLRREAEEMAKRMQFQHAEAPSIDQAPDAEEGEEGEQGPGQVVPLEPVRAEPKIGRNELCPCGSGKKYKHCHGQVN